MLSRHFSSTVRKAFRQEIAFVFDIDGVLLRGKNPIPRASSALQLLNKHKVPFILMTNGGGVSEQHRIDFISKQLNTPLSVLQIVQSHTPMKAYAHNGDFNRVLVVGGPGDEARKVAHEYGFSDVVTPGDILRKYPLISPHHRYTDEDFAKFTRDVDVESAVDAILVFNDPRDVGTDTQIVSDYLNSENGVIGTRRSLDKISDKTRPAVPIVFSNNDFLWANDYSLPRFGQGAFRIGIEALYAETNGLRTSEKLTSTILGKPFKIQYDFAHSVLINWREKLLAGKTHETQLNLPPLNETPKESPFSKIYMVGDNPASDIQGANDNGWESLLLRTGVFRDEDWEHAAAWPTAGVHNDVYDAVEFALKENGVN